MDKSKKKKRGRPVGSKAKSIADKQLPRIRVMEHQIVAYKAASERSGKSLSAWVRDSLDQAVKKSTN